MMDITPVKIGEKVVEIGDHVRLKSRGPKMTVIGIDTGKRQENLIRCVWIGEDSIGCHDFGPHTLEIYRG